MSIQVDARLHLSQPEIILRNSQTGEILMRWYRATVQPGWPMGISATGICSTQTTTGKI